MNKQVCFGYTKSESFFKISVKLYKVIMIIPFFSFDHYIDIIISKLI